jgi:ABC-type polysaccharide/polyol phosphate export permease
MIKKALGQLYINYCSSNSRLERIWKIAQVDFKKRYYNDKLGLLWALINPMTQIAIYYFVFTKIFQREQENYVLYLFCGILTWLAFSEATKMGSRVLIRKKYLTENIQFNWLDLYLSHMISIMMGLAFNFGAYLVILLLTGASLGKYILLLPVVLLTLFLISSALAITLGLIRPIFDDIVHIWEIALMVGFWVSGIFFSGQFYYDNYPWFVHVNPFVGILLNMRACLLVNNEIYWGLLIENLVVGIILYAIAVQLFKKYAKKVIEKV